jgi:inosose dehydratase
MQVEYSRRTLIKTLGLGAGAACLGTGVVHGAPVRKLKIGMTSINWGFSPEDAEPGIRDSAKLGYHGYEVFGNSLDALEAKGGLRRILEQYRMPMPSGYLNVNLSNPAVRKTQFENVARWGKVIRGCGSSVAVIGPNAVNRSTYDFKAAKADLVTMLNEVGKMLADLGLTAALHQHTGTCIETRDEVYAILDAVDTRVMRFGPDVGQLQKGGSDPVKLLKDFLPLLRSIHLKDYLGEQYWAGYCPLGQGKVDIPGVMDVLEKSNDMEYAMVELDMTKGAPTPPFECAVASKEYLRKLGYTFRS